MSEELLTGNISVPIHRRHRKNEGIFPEGGDDE